MQISTRFTIAVHSLLCIAKFQDSQRVTSALIARSVNTNPVTIRRILGQLREAGLVQIKPGTGGATLRRAPEDISLLEVFRAVEPVGDDQLFNFHPNPNPQCPVGSRIHAVLDEELQAAQQALENYLQQRTLSELTDKLFERLDAQTVEAN